VAKILLVHDDVAETARLRRGLREAGHEATVAPGIADAEALTAACDAVVADAAYDGGEALGWARRLAADPAAPPVVIVGDASGSLPAAPPLPALLAAVDAALARGRAGRPRAPETVGPARAAAPPAARPALARTAEAALRVLFGARSARLAPAEARARLEELGHLARTADYFEVLGVPRGCTTEEARLAADSLLAAAERDLAPAITADPSLAPLLQDVRQVLLDARDVVGDAARREAYRAGLEAASPPEVADDGSKR
jgi:hypothetical protein